MRSDFPDGVVVAVEAYVVEVFVIALHAGGVDLVDIRGQVVVLRIEADLDPVRGRTGVAPAESCGDARGIAVEAADGDVEVSLVVGDLYHRPLAERRQIVGFPLDEVGDLVDGLPGLVGQAAVNLRCRSGQRESTQSFTDFGLGGRLPGVGPRRGGPLGVHGPGTEHRAEDQRRDLQPHPQSGASISRAAC